MKQRPDVSRTVRLTSRVGLVAVATAALVVAGGLPASGHGYVGGSGSDVASRASLTSNSGRGAVQYEPQSIEGPKGFPDRGPADGTIASGGVGRFHELDEQSSARWVKNSVAPGTIDVGWTYTAIHATSKWHYYLTKPGWDQNAPLTRATLEPVAEVRHDGSVPTSKGTRHSVTIPGDREGYHVLLGVWDIADTGNAFYQVVDLDVQPNAGTASPRPGAPTQLTSTGTTSSTVSLAWKAPAGAQVDHYTVFRDGKQIGRTTSTTFVDTGLSARTKHSYHVVAVTAAQVGSDPSNTITATTGSDRKSVRRPGAPRQLHTMQVTANAVELMWSAPASGTKPTQYIVQRAAAEGDFAVVGMTDGLEFADGGLTPSSRYRYRVVAVDTSGNASKPSDILTVTTESLHGDGNGHGDGSGTASGTGGGGSGEGVAATSWDARSAYTLGDIVTHDGRRYVCIQSYQGHGDPNWINAPSLWTLQK